MFSVSDSWLKSHPGAKAGILVMRGVENPPLHPALENAKRDLETSLRAQFSGKEPSALGIHGPIPAYNRYYRQYEKSYHVQGQLASVVFKGKAIPSVAALVEAMFLAELKNCLLTAGHDLDSLSLPVSGAAASGQEQYTTLRGQNQTLKAGDLFMADQAGIISSILYGPDQRTQITPATRNVLYAVYAPDGVSGEMVTDHLRDIEALVRLFCDKAVTELAGVFPVER